MCLGGLYTCSGATSSPGVRWRGHEHVDQLRLEMAAVLRGLHGSPWHRRGVTNGEISIN